MAPPFNFPGAYERGRRSGPEGRKGERRLSKELKTAIRTVAGTHVRLTYQGRIIREKEMGVHPCSPAREVGSATEEDCERLCKCASRMRFSHPAMERAIRINSSDFIDQHPQHDEA